MDVKSVCLGLLMDADYTGYEIQKRLKDEWLSLFFEASYGSIYPALNRLTDEDLVSCTEQTQDGRPDKKIYSITDKGRDAFLNALLEPVTEDKYRSDFMARLFFSQNLPPLLIKRVLDERARHHETELAKLDDLDSDALTPPELFLQGWGRTFHESALTYLKTHRHMLEDTPGQTFDLHPALRAGAAK